jgi:hypothetical protein
MDYEDIIDMPHHVSSRHQPMSMYARAAQFAPFAALTGYEDAISTAEKEHTQTPNNEDDTEML